MSDGTTGMSQQLGDLQLHTPNPIQPPPGLEGEALLQELVEQEIMKHFEIVRAASGGASQVVPRSIRNVIELKEILKALGYATEAKNEWHVLGLAPLEGPDISLHIIESRLRTARLLISAASAGDWNDDEKIGAEQILNNVEAAADGCVEGFDEWKKERRRVKPSKLPLWKELGPKALKVILDSAPALDEKIITQWFDVLDNTAMAMAHQDRIVDQQIARSLAAASEKGEDHFWDMLQGDAVVMWAPGDTSALGRLLGALLRRGPSAQTPSYVRMVVPMDILPGCVTVDSIKDLWWHALLGEKWSAMVKGIEMIKEPLEFVLPASAGPRHELRGLALFTISTSMMQKQLPKILEVEVPLFQMEALPTFALDFSSNDVVKIMQILNDGSTGSMKHSHIRRSPGHQEETPRVMVDLRFPYGTTRLDQELKMRQIRRKLPPGAYFGSHDLYTDRSAMIAEIGHAGSSIKIWPMCSGMLFLARDKLLITSDAEEATWQPVLDKMLQEDPEGAVFRIRRKPSRHGGRPFVTPSATAGQLAATRRARGARTKSEALRSITDVDIKGHAQADEHAVLQQLMAHVKQYAGVNLEELNGVGPVKPGCWKWLAADDPNAPPGRVRLYLQSETEVQAIKAMIHGSTIRVGVDSLLVQVANDILDARPNQQQRTGRGRGGAR